MLVKSLMILVMRKGEELKAPRHASAAATRDIFPTKGIGVLEEKGLKSINKEELLKNKLLKGDLRGAATKVLGVVSLVREREPILLLLSSKDLIL